MSISDRLRELRTNFGLTQPEMAERFHIPLPSWKSNEKGPSQPGADALRNLANGGVNVHWLLTGEGAMLIQQAGEPAIKYMDQVERLSTLLVDLVNQEASDENNYKLAQDAMLLAQHRLFGDFYLSKLLIGLYPAG